MTTQYTVTKITTGYTVPATFVKQSKHFITVMVMGFEETFSKRTLYIERKFLQLNITTSEGTTSGSLYFCDK